MCHASLVARRTRVTNAAFSPPAGARAQRTPTPPAYSADYATFQAWQRAHASGQGSTQQHSNTTNRTPPRNYWDQYATWSSDMSDRARWYQQQGDQCRHDREERAEDWDPFHIDPNAAGHFYKEQGGRFVLVLLLVKYLWSTVLLFLRYHYLHRLS
jgi:hypothetical protein